MSADTDTAWDEFRSFENRCRGVDCPEQFNTRKKRNAHEQGCPAAQEQLRIRTTNQWWEKLTDARMKMRMALDMLIDNVNVNPDLIDVDIDAVVSEVIALRDEVQRRVTP